MLNADCGGLVRLCAVYLRADRDADDDDVYYPRGRRPREDEQEEESYKKQRKDERP